MRKRDVWAIVGLAACAVLLLLAQRLRRPAVLADEANASAVSGAQSVRKALADKLKVGRPALSGLAAAYAPGVVVITNGVLEPDPRHNFDPRPGMEDHEGWERYREEMRETAKHGEKGKATFHVVDTDGNSVAGADISAGFYGGSGGSGQTDADGLFVVEGKTLNGASLLYTIKKQGFYQTRAEYQLGKRGYRCLENGRWIPWNPTLRVTLKAIRKPIPMYIKKAKIIFPGRNEYFKYDLLVGDWVEPHGKGNTADISLMYQASRSRSSEYLDFTKELEIRGANEMDGFILMTKDVWSEFGTLYEAPTVGYSASISLCMDRTPTNIIRRLESSASDYYVFKSRTRLVDGMEVSHYGKILGGIDYGSAATDTVGGSATLRYYFNPTPNDRNLEFDGKNNLFDPAWRDLSWPK